VSGATPPIGPDPPAQSVSTGFDPYTAGIQFCSSIGGRS
jgi:hypothetical protein